MGANYHGGAEVMNYPWDNTYTFHADDAWYQMICHEYADLTHQVNPNYMNDYNNGITNGAQWYMIGGGRQDYMNGYAQCRELTIECSNTKLPSGSQLPNFWNYNKESIFAFMNQCLYGIHGTVTDKANNQPLNATITITNHDDAFSVVESHLPAGDYHRPIKGGTYSVTYSAEGYYPKTVNISVSDGQCTIQDVQLVPEGWSIDEYNSPAFVIHPNPTHGYLYVTSMVRPPKQYDFQMFDIAGRLIHRTKVEAGTSTLDITTLPAGTYAIRILDDNQVIYQTKIVKE